MSATNRIRPARGAADAVPEVPVFPGSRMVYLDRLRIGERSFSDPVKLSPS